MITKINLNSVAGYKSLTALETDKKVNLIYGLNGTGKSNTSLFCYVICYFKEVVCAIGSPLNLH